MTLRLDISKSKELTLTAKAQAKGLSTEQYVQQIIDRDLEQNASPPLSTLFRSIWADLPDHAKLPHDSLDQIDHYVYGTSKEEE